jgi:hypothetical protein
VSKLPWESLPPGRVAAIETVTGPVVKAESVSAGLTPGLTAVLHTVNGAPADSPAARLYERELAANATRLAGLPAPRMLLGSGDNGWLLMVFEFLQVRDADLSPGSPDLDAALAAVAAIGSVRAWDTAPPVTENVSVLTEKAVALLGKRPGGHPWDMYRAAVEGFDAAPLGGDQLVHYDLHAGNLKITENGAGIAVDWAFACAVTGLAALWTVFREYKASYGPEDARAFRGQAARAGRGWVEYRTRVLA